jgi:hypothetical protein
MDLVDWYLLYRCVDRDIRGLIEEIFDKFVVAIVTRSVQQHTSVVISID